MKHWRSATLALLLAIFSALLAVKHSAALSLTTFAISFPSATINGSDQLISGSTSAWQADATGEAGGWHATMTATDFSNGSGDTIAVSNFQFRLLDSNISLVSGDPTLPFSSQTTYISLSGTPAKFVSASSGTADGVYNLLPEFQLTVPAETYAGTYTSTLTLVINTGP